MKSCRGNSPSPSGAESDRRLRSRRASEAASLGVPAASRIWGCSATASRPLPDEVTEPVVEVAVSVEVCPGCGGRLEDEGMGVAYVTDISSDSASAGDGVPGADMSVPVLRQAGPRPPSRYWVEPVRRQRPPGWETSDRGGSRAPLRGGRSGKKGSRCAQSADRGGSESGSDQPGRAATCHGCGGVSLPQAADLGGRESTRPHR